MSKPRWATPIGSVPPAGAHGGDGARIAAALGIPVDEVLDLSASMNPVAPDPTPVITASLGAVHRYPDTGHARAALADALSVDTESVLLTNGGAEAIALVAGHLGRGWADDSEFSLYRRHIPVLDPNGPRFRSNPHNPTGRLADPMESAGVWDEAFYPLATGTWTARREGIVVGSLTKLFSCPGLRIGYVIADPETIDRLAFVQPAWSVNAIALEALPRFINTADLQAWSQGIADLRQKLTKLLDGFGLEPQPSAANFILCRRAMGLRERLAPTGVVVRDCASFGMPGCARIAVPNEDGIERLHDALDVIM